MSPSACPPSNSSYADKIKWFHENSPDFTTLATESTKDSHDTPTTEVEKGVEGLHVREEIGLDEQIKREFLDIGGKEVLLRHASKEQVKEKKEDQNASSSS